MLHKVLKILPPPEYLQQGLRSWVFPVGAEEPPATLPACRLRFATTGVLRDVLSGKWYKRRMNYSGMSGYSTVRNHVLFKGAERVRICLRGQRCGQHPCGRDTG